MFHTILLAILDVMTTQTEGFLLGMATALVIGRVVTWYRKMKGAIQAPYKPLKVELPTKETPAEVVNKSWAAQWVLRLFWWGIVLGVGYLIWDALKQP